MSTSRPALLGALLPRPRLRTGRSLTAHGQASPATPLLLFCAPAGYGKTTAVLQWAEDLGLTEEQMRWVTCSPGSAEDEQLWRAVAAALTGETVRQESGALAEVHRVVAELRTPLTVVLDDYHRATTPEHDLELARLIERNPMLTIVVLTRHVRLLDSPLVTSRVPAAIVDRHELAFTEEEISAFIDLIGADVDEQTRTLLDSSRGWPVAVRVLLEARASPAAEAPPPSPGDAAAERLHLFVLHHLELLPETARELLLASSLLDAVSVELSASITGLPVNEVRTHLVELRDLGLLVSADESRGEYRCHPLARRPLSKRALRHDPEGTRAALMRARASEIETVDPLGAFKLFSQVGAYAEAEVALARHFTRITDRSEQALTVLRSIPDEKLLQHPVFAAARLYLEPADPSCPLEGLRRLTDRMLAGSEQRLAAAGARWSATGYLPTAGSAEPGSPSPLLSLTAMLHVMAAKRLLGDLAGALALAEHLEAAAGLDEIAGDSLLIFLAEIASTALAGERLALARRNWVRLLGSAALAGAQGEQAWRACAYEGLALTEALDGDIVEAEKSLAEADAIRRTLADAGLGSPGPGLSWITGEAARATLAYERERPEELRELIPRIEPWADRLEPWPVILLADVQATRITRGDDWALPQLETGIAHFEEHRRGAGSWRTSLTLELAALSTRVGDFVAAERTLSGLPQGDDSAALERARIALFSSDGVRGVLSAQRIGTAALTKRQRTDLHFIAAASAWICSSRDEAFASLQIGAERLRRHGLASPLWGIPYDILRELGEAARDAGVCDLIAEIDAIPEPVRCSRYEPLSEMERRTLETIAEHGRIALAAEALFVAQGTVKAHLRSIYRKLRVSSRGEAILRATRMGILELDPGTVTVQPLDETFPSERLGRTSSRNRQV